MLCKLLTEHDLQIADGLLAGYALGVATFGGNLRLIRERLGVSQEELAKRLGHKRPSTVQSWEKNRRRPRPKNILDVATKLGVPPAELVDDVPGDYDTLKGVGHPTADARSAAELTPIEKRALRLFRKMNERGQRLAVSNIAGIAPAFPREPQPKPAALPAHKNGATKSRAPGKRKAAGG